MKFYKIGTSDTVNVCDIALYRGEQQQTPDLIYVLSITNKTEIVVCTTFKLSIQTEWDGR